MSKRTIKHLRTLQHMLVRTGDISEYSSSLDGIWVQAIDDAVVAVRTLSKIQKIIEEALKSAQVADYPPDEFETGRLQAYSKIMLTIAKENLGQYNDQGNPSTPKINP
jgi:hypothetical protein